MSVPPVDTTTFLDGPTAREGCVVALGGALAADRLVALACVVVPRNAGVFPGLSCCCLVIFLGPIFLFIFHG